MPAGQVPESPTPLVSIGHPPTSDPVPAPLISPATHGVRDSLRGPRISSPPARLPEPLPPTVAPEPIGAQGEDHLPSPINPETLAPGKRMENGAEIGLNVRHRPGTRQQALWRDFPHRPGLRPPTDQTRQNRSVRGSGDAGVLTGRTGIGPYSALLHFWPTHLKMD